MHTEFLKAHEGHDIGHDTFTFLAREIIEGLDSSKLDDFSIRSGYHRPGIKVSRFSRQTGERHDVLAQLGNEFNSRLLAALIKEAGGSMEHLVKLVIYITDVRHREAVYQTMGTYIKGVHPVSTGLVVQALARPEWLVEIDGTAVIPEGYVP